MKKYTYYFADGTKSTIEVEDKWYDILKEMDEAERKSKYNTILSTEKSLMLRKRSKSVSRLLRTDCAVSRKN